MDEMNNQVLPGETPEQHPANTAPQPVPGVTVSLDPFFLKNLANWASFKAIIDIITGALACLGIITAAYGVPLIISGVKLLGATEDLKTYLASNDAKKISDSFANLSKYFRINGISIIIKIVLQVLVFIGLAILYGIMISYFMRNMPDIMRNLPSNGY